MDSEPVRAEQAVKCVFESLDHVTVVFPFPTTGIESAAELEKPNEIWELNRIFTTYSGTGAKVIKKHDAPARAK